MITIHNVAVARWQQNLSLFLITGGGRLFEVLQDGGVILKPSLAL